MSMRRTVVVAMVVALSVLSTTACSGLFGATGDDVASDRMNAVATEMARSLDRPVDRDRTAEYLASSLQFVIPAPGNAETIDVIPLSWEGSTTAEGGATVTARISVTVPAKSATKIGDFSSRGAGSASGCYSFHLERHEAATASAVSCPEEVAAPPVYTPPPSLPDDARDQVEAALLRAQKTSVEGSVIGLPLPIEAEQELREVFPDPIVILDVAEFNNTIVAAVGIPAERECIVAQLEEPGEVQFPYFDRISLEPGELGCSTELVTAPPL